MPKMPAKYKMPPKGMPPKRMRSGMHMMPDGMPMSDKEMQEMMNQRKSAKKKKKK